MTDEWQDIAIGPDTAQTPDVWEDVAMGPSEPSSLIGGMASEFVGGVKDTPEAIKGLFDTGTYKEAFKDPETGARTIGRGAAMTAGGVTGAEAGAALGAFGGPIAPVTVPVGAVLGGGIGAALGLLGFDSAEEAAKEGVDLIAGTDIGTDRPVIPGKKELLEASRAAGTATTMGALGKGVGAAGKGIKKATGGLVKSAEERIVGLRPQDIEKSLKTRSVEYIDDAGNRVPVSEASDFAARIEQDAATVSRDGAFKDITNNPRQTKVVFDQKTAQAGQSVDAAHAATKNAISAVESQSGIKIKFRPDFSKAEALIADIAETDPTLGKTLARKLRSIEDQWARSDRSYDALLEKKRAFGSAAKWDRSNSTADLSWNAVKKEVHNAYNEQLIKANNAARKTSPDIPSLSDANAKFSAYKNLEPLIKKKATRGKPGIFESRSLRGEGITGIPVLDKLLRAPKQIAERSEATDLAVRGAVQKGGALLGGTGEVVGGVTSKYGPGIGGLESTLDPVEEENLFSALLDVKDANASPLSETSNRASSENNLFQRVLEGKQDEGEEAINKSNILWKPVAENGGKLVVLFPKAVGNITIRDAETGQVLDTGRSTGPSNGYGDTVRFNKPGSAFKNVVIEDGDGNDLFVQDGSIRDENLASKRGKAEQVKRQSKASEGLPGIDKVVSLKEKGVRPETETLIRDAASNEGVSPKLLRALVEQESGGNPDAVGYETPETKRQGTRAQGLGQLMPKTARAQAKKMGIKNPDLKDPETNLKISANYLKEMLDRFKGDIELALTAYHSGPTRVAALLKETGGDSLSDIIDRLGPAGQKYASQVLARV